MLNANKTYGRVLAGPDTASRLHPYNSPTPRGSRYRDSGKNQSVGRGVSPLNRPDSSSRDCYPHPPRAKTKWYAPQYKDKSNTLSTRRGMSPLNRPAHSRDYDPRPSAAKTRWYSPQYKDSAKNRYRRHSPDNRQQFNNVSPLNRPAKETTQTHPRPNSKPGKVSYEGNAADVNDATPAYDLPLSKTQGEITRFSKVEIGDFSHYRSGTSDDEGYASTGNNEDLPPQLQPPVHTARGKRRRRRDRKNVEVHLVTSLARLSLKSSSDVELAVVSAREACDRKVISTDPDRDVEFVLHRKRKRYDPLPTVAEKQRKIVTYSVDNVCLQKSSKDADGKDDVVTSTSATDVIEAIDLCLQSMVKVKDTTAPTTEQKDKAVTGPRRQRRRWRRNGQKSSNNSESRRYISRVDEDPLDLSG